MLNQFFEPQFIHPEAQSYNKLSTWAEERIKETRIASPFGDEWNVYVLTEDKNICWNLCEILSLSFVGWRGSL